MIGRVILVGSNKCPICGQEFMPTPPLRPNVKDKEFYGGRVAFFKEVECRCRAKYDLCIEKRFRLGEDRLEVINMIVLEEGTPLEEIKKEEDAKLRLEADQAANEAVAKAIEEKGDLPTLQQREEIKRQVVLATIEGKEEKIQKLKVFTEKELKAKCKHRKLRVTNKDNKTTLAEKLLEYDPNII